eukprot:Plantae.Rhodophyta-Hildenbrandia_rubra.ctg4486.p1 GENE.Plantae.Rhodophyta-Hildenbrandia_rubra.ctg4486~~Plantae.Rhodophyta-Hildenbrandia_rubra.ctg4486.p1  ORF type:complete len:396 (+),score=129.89 Plantae.Rhodophyta-Hildenbrandia_rubra.ctg4486:599-1786(+)
MSPPAESEPPGSMEASVLSEIIMEKDLEREKEKEGGDGEGSLWSDVSLEGVGKVGDYEKSEEEDGRSEDGADVCEETVGNGVVDGKRDGNVDGAEVLAEVELGSGGENVDDIIHRRDADVENDNVGSEILLDEDDEEDGHVGKEFDGDNIEQALDMESGIDDSGSEIEVSSSDEEDYDEDVADHKGVTGDSGSETYYDDEEDLGLAASDLWEPEDGLSSIARVYESSCSSGSDDEIDYGGEAESEFHEESDTQKLDDPEQVAEKKVHFADTETVEIGSDDFVDDKQEFSVHGEVDQSVVRWKGGCRSGCSKRTDLERRLGAVMKLLSEIQLWTAERAAEGGAAVRKDGHGGGRRGKQSETAKLRKEVEKLRVTLDYLTKMSLEKAVELHASIANR